MPSGRAKTCRSVLLPSAGAFSVLLPSAGAFSVLFPSAGAFSVLLPSAGAFSVLLPSAGAFSVLFPSAGAFSRHCVRLLRISLTPVNFVIFVLVSVYSFTCVHLFVRQQSNYCVMCYHYKLTSMHSQFKKVYVSFYCDTRYNWHVL